MRVLAADGSGRDSDIAAGIVWAADHGADVINLSMAGPQSTRILKEAVRHALDADALVVAATGNTGTRRTQYPAGHDGVVGVSATNHSGDFAYYSSHGAAVDVAAPGHEVAATWWRSGSAEQYAAASGTSGASALVSGAAALVRAAHPSLNQATVAERLRGSARDAGPRDS